MIEADPCAKSAKKSPKRDILKAKKTSEVAKC